MQFQEDKLELVIANMLNFNGIKHIFGGSINRSNDDILIKDNLIDYLKKNILEKKSLCKRLILFANH